MAAIRLACVGLVAILLPGAAPAEETGRIEAAMDRAFRPLLTQYEVPGLAVAVTIDGRRTIRTYGVAAKDTNAAVTQDTLFEIGSVSKTFTTTLALYARALGKLSLDDHPAKYMPELRGSALDRATLLHLGTYSAGGLPLQFPADVGTEGEMVTYVRHWSPSAAPGVQRRYSNPSLGLLGHLTARAMGRPFADLLETELLPKLGLSHTHIRVPATRMGSYARGYDKAGRPIRVAPGVFDAEAYGVKSSVSDMIAYVEANLRPERFEAPLRHAIADGRTGYFKVGEMVQGLGWEHYPYPVSLDRLLAGNSEAMARETQPATALAPASPLEGSVLFNKTGSTNGFGAYVAFVPARQIGIVMLANRNIPIPARITAAHAVLEELASHKR